MASHDCATILKRGYLIDKKGGLLQGGHKRWFMLRQNISQGYCILEYFKDERSAAKGEPPKGFINVLDVVEVQRPERRQCIELLCPGLAHRLMANSEAEADDWADILRKQLLYRKDNLKTLSLQRIMTHPPMSGTHSPLSSSPPGAVVPNSAHFSHSLMIPQSTHPLFSPGAATGTVPMFGIEPPPMSSQTQTILNQAYPTPPESVINAPIGPPPPFQKQGSNEGVNPYPSPPSSDSSSVCGGSNASFDNTSVVDGDIDLTSRLKFRVHVRESDKLTISGPCDLAIFEDGISLYSVQTGHQVAMWPINSIRRYGVNNVCFTFETGRNCFTGEGKFYFYGPQSRLIHSRVHQMAQRSTVIREHRRASAPESIMHRALMIPENNQIQRSPGIDSSPPQYNHIEHLLKPNLSLDPYGKLTTNAMRLAQAHIQPDYDKPLFGNHTIQHSKTVPSMHTPQCNYVSIQHEEETPIYSNLELTKKEEEEKTTKMSSDVLSSNNNDDSIPPPLPPRLTKMTSI